MIALLIGAAVLLLIKKPSRDVDPTAPGKPRSATRRRAPDAGLALALSFAIGAYDGFFGPGTGTFLIVGFVALCGAASSRATADAKVVNFASNLAALATFSHADAVVWHVSLRWRRPARRRGPRRAARDPRRRAARVLVLSCPACSS